MKLKVYGWSSFRDGNQSREIVAVHSWAAAFRATKATGNRISLGHMRSYGGETGNPEEVALAMSEPGTVFWCNSRFQYQKDRQWQKATKTSTP